MFGDRTPLSRARPLALPGLALVATLLLGACEDGPTDPGLEGAFEETGSLELDVTVNPELTDAALRETEALLSGTMTGAAEAEIQEAALHFQAAEASFHRGDRADAVRLGEEARLALGRALVAGGGDAVADQALELAEAVRYDVEGDAAAFDRPDILRTDLGRYLDEARDRQRQGDHARAAARAILARQHADWARIRPYHRDRPGLERAARLAVAMANEGVHLAHRILSLRSDVPERQNRVLEAAERMARRAARLLGAGRLRGALILGHRSVHLSLWAVVLPELDRADVEQVDGAARALLDQAGEYLEANPNDRLQALLRRAETAYRKGAELVAEGHLRGIVLLWRAGVVAAVILP